MYPDIFVNADLSRTVKIIRPHDRCFVTDYVTSDIHLTWQIHFIGYNNIINIVLAETANKFDFVLLIVQRGFLLYPQKNPTDFQVIAHIMEKRCFSNDLGFETPGLSTLNQRERLYRQGNVFEYGPKQHACCFRM